MSITKTATFLHKFIKVILSYSVAMFWSSSSLLLSVSTPGILQVALLLYNPQTVHLLAPWVCLTQKREIKVSQNAKFSQNREIRVSRNMRTSLFYNVIYHCRVQYLTSVDSNGETRWEMTCCTHLSRSLPFRGWFVGKWKAACQICNTCSRPGRLDVFTCELLQWLELNIIEKSRTSEVLKLKMWKRRIVELRCNRNELNCLYTLVKQRAKNLRFDYHTFCCLSISRSTDKTISFPVVRGTQR